MCSLGRMRLRDHSLFRSCFTAGWRRLGKCDATRNLARFYEVDIQPTLFGNWAVVCRWGRIGTHGRVGQDWLPSLAEAQTEQAHRVAQKCRRGYGHLRKTGDGNTNDPSN